MTQLLLQSPIRHKRKYLSMSVILILCLTIIFSAIQTNLTQASTVSLSFTPVADAYVSQSQPVVNYGTNRSLRVDASPVTRSYLRFDVKGITTGTVSKVTLSIYANSSSAIGYSVRKVADNTWQENQINYNNMPALGTLVSTSKASSANTWVNVDITPAIQANGLVSLALTINSNTAVNLAAREAGANAPKLLIETTSTATATTAAPTAAPTRTVTRAIANTPQPTTNLTSQPSATYIPFIENQPSFPSFPIRAAFYYPWFPEAWNQQGYIPFANYNPTLGQYNSSSVSTIQNHIKALTYGNIQAAILSWWGQGSNTDKRIATILGATPGSSNPHFRWSLYYENESMGDPAQSQIQSDLVYIQNNYGRDPSFLRVNGKFVVFVYADANDTCGMADRWVKANQGLGSPAYVVLKVFGSYLSCPSQPDSWHQYAPAVATDHQAGYSYAISPGFWLKGATVRLARDLPRWTTNVSAMVASGEKWQLVTTFNEWGEGTSVESAAEWASPSGYGQYLDALHNLGATPVPTTTSQPTNPPQPTLTPTPTPVTTVTPSPTPAAGNDPIIFFTGDLVSGSTVSRANQVVTLIKNLMAQHPGTAMLLASTGDNEQENNPTLANYQNYFGSTYGWFVQQGIFMQVRGNHDIQSAGTYTDYNGTVHASGGAYWDYFGANAHAANSSGQMLTNYSYDLGSWHIIALDQLNGSVNSATLNFLTSDLALNPNAKCQLVYWHVPTYSSGAAHGDSLGLKPINQAAYNAGVDIQINGHDHDYQRFYPLNPSGQRDDARGITTFIDGIGGQAGRSGSQISAAQAASAVYLETFLGDNAIGVIQFTLHATSADYALYDANSGAILDQGTVNCH